MKFTEWWDGAVWHPADKTYRYRELKDWCSEAFNQGLREGLRRAQVALGAPTQGGGSQDAATDALKPISVNKS